MKESIPALSRLTSIEHVAAAFVFNSKADILAREVPERYTDENLRQIALQIQSLDSVIRSTDTSTHEVQARFDNYAIWIRCFQGDNIPYFLVLFLGKDVDFPILQQPVNLAVLNLEKVVQRSESELLRDAAQSDLAKIAQDAEKTLFSTSGNDTNGLYAKLGLIANYLLGPIGDDLLISGCRDLDLHLPLEKMPQIQSLVDYCAKEIIDPERKNAFLNQAEDVIQRLLLDKKIST